MHIYPFKLFYLPLANQKAPEPKEVSCLQIMNAQKAGNTLDSMCTKFVDHTIISMAIDSLEEKFL